jgi:hypothetical protein
MRNLPLQFVDENTIELIAEVHRREEHAVSVAGPLGLRTRTVLEHWPAIQEHKWFLSQKLGRDIGARVAALDYLENVKREPIKNIQNWAAKVWRAVLANLDADGPRSIANFERVMKRS